MDNMESSKSTHIPKDIPFTFAKRHGVLVLEQNDKSARIIQKETAKPYALLELRRCLQIPLTIEQVSEDKFEDLLTKAYETNSQSAMQMAVGMSDEMDLEQLMHDMPKTEDLMDSEDDAPIIRLLNALLTEAIKQGASDIHIETFEAQLIVRFRIDGILREILKPQRVLAPLIVSRIKVMAKLDIAEKRLPQDGRITLRLAGRAVDVRVSTIPASHGERVVLRLLDKKSAHLDLEQLGMGEETLGKIKRLISRPHGIILVTGPTGSGKTTSLYAALTELNDVSRNILTVEDPIEYDLQGIGQTQVNVKVDMTFAKGLRAILRQDPDVVMVGEIRDVETAQIAVQASLTGHLVLSTLHTNSALGAITRLQDMGVKPFLISSSLIGLLAQRLVRVLWHHCKQSSPATAAECETLGMKDKSPPDIYHAVGCDSCTNTGYIGRTGIYELVLIDEKLRTMIHEGKSENQMEKYIREFTPMMRECGFRKILEGETTLEEVLRITNEDSL